MAKVTVGLPQGTRDFGPATVRKRNYIFNTIRAVFELYGFQPLETPAMENLETLMGKYGEEGDKLIFKILNNGLSDPKNTEKAKTAFEQVLKGKNDKNLTERALKYDLTIPFARYVATNHSQLVFPFKRYQIQPVWRADRPQKGRYREFYQCDADVVGSKSLLNEVELSNIYHEVFMQLGIVNYELRINSRKILAGLAEVAGLPHQLTDITVAIDKLDKIGIDGVKKELVEKKLNDQQVKLIADDFLSISDDTLNNTERLSKLKDFFANNSIGQEGISELEVVLASAQHSLKPFFIDTTLARGLNYYTGIIFEAKAPAEVKMGSIGGGGRYDDLTGLFGVPNIPGVGISFGVDRIYDVMEELQLFPTDVFTGTQALFFNLGEQPAATAFGLLQQLRRRGIRAELFHENSKFDKQFGYAEKKGIPYVIIIGEDELSANSCKIKNIRTGEQQTISQDELVQQFLFT